MKKRILLSSPHLSGQEINFIQNAFDINWVAPGGPGTEVFEKAIARYTGSQNVAAVYSGSAALHLALMSLGVGKGDVVLCQSLTFAASAFPIQYQQALPVFIGSEKQTWNICPDALEVCIAHYIRKGKKPKAVIGVHLFGMPLLADEVIGLCRKYEIPFIEDAAEALGSSYRNQKAGSLGTIGVFSFNGNKIITASAGGAMISEDDALISHARFLASQARDTAPHYQHSKLGYNYQMSNICAAIGLGQMSVIDERVGQRRANFDFYQDELGSLPGLTFQNEPDHCHSNRWLTAICIDPVLSGGVTRETLRLHLESENIESRPVWKPMHLQPVFKHTKFYGDGLSEKLFQNGLCLPSGSNLTPDDIQDVVGCIKKSFRDLHEVP